MHRMVTRGVMLFALTLPFAGASQASSIGYEVLSDLSLCTTSFFSTCTTDSVDLSRDRFSSGTGLGTTTLDSTIISENSVNGDFGRFNANTVSYVHDLNFLSPAVGSYLTATLTITAWGVNCTRNEVTFLCNPDDTVSADSIILGYLVDHGLFDTTFSTTMLTTTVFGNLSLLASLGPDNTLSIVIDKNDPPGSVFGDRMEIRSSRLDVTYDAVAEPVTPVPEPATMLLVGTGLVGAGARGWRKRRAS